MEMGETSKDVPEEVEVVDIVSEKNTVASVETADSISVSNMDDPSEDPEDNSEPDLPHPYQDKLLSFKPCEWQLKKQVPVAPIAMEDAKLTYVDSQTLLDEMMVIVRQEKEIAISVQHQSYQRFQGICSLVLISTRSEDFIIDAIVLKDKIPILNDILIDSNVLKVIHRVKLDLEMLHVAGLYAVNVFDTSSAGRITKDQKAQRSLAEMLRGYCFVEHTDIEHYKTDWSVRPLPENMLKYARLRVHYLLYIHDILRNELVEKKQIEEQYKRCTQLCKVVWHPGKSRYSETSYMKVYNGIAKGQGKGERKGSLNPQQLECFRLLFNWRHETAKRNDKSLGYTLPTQDMYEIAKILPRKKESIKGCCHHGVLPPLVKQYLQDFHNLVLKAIESVPYNAAVREPEAKKQRKGTPQQSGQKSDNSCRKCWTTGHVAANCKTDLIERSRMAGNLFKRGRGFSGHFGMRPVLGSVIGHTGPGIHAGMRPIGPGMYAEPYPLGQGIHADSRPVDRGMHSGFQPVRGGMHSGFRPIRGRIGGLGMHPRGSHIFNQLANRLGAIAHDMAMNSDDNMFPNPSTHSSTREQMHSRGPLSRGRNRNPYEWHERGR